MLPSPFRLQARPPGLLTFGATCAFACATAWGLASIPRMLLSMGFRDSVSFLPAIRATRLLTFTLAGLAPAEHASLCWTHNPPCKFPCNGLSRDWHSRRSGYRFPFIAAASSTGVTRTSPGDLRLFCSPSVTPLAPFPLYAAFPRSEYYGASDACWFPWWTAHLRQQASHVHTDALDEVT